MNKEKIAAELLDLFNDTNVVWADQYSPNIRFDVFLQANYSKEAIREFFPELSKIVHNLRSQ